MFIRYGKSIFFCFLSIAFGIQVPKVYSDGVVIKYWKESHSVGLQPYQNEVITAALESSKQKYGPYSLEVESMLFSSQRSKIETQNGDLINVMFASEWRGTLAEQNKVSTIHHPFLKNMLGFRSCIIHKASLKKFSKIKTRSEALNLTLVQGQDWLDTDILEEGEFNVQKVMSMENMLSMIDRGRVDCFPLSVLEVDGYLEHYGEKYPNLTVAPDFYLFYPLRVYLAIPSNEPLLFQRIHHGITMIESNGEMDKIFRKHFGNKIIDINKKGIRFFALHNSAYSKSENEKIINKFVKVR